MSLLSLPFELREMIFDYATYCDSADLHIGFQTLVPSTCTPNAVQPPVTRVNKQIRSESLATFYRSNSFVLCLHNDKAVRRCQKWIALNKACFRYANGVSLSIHWWNRHGHAALNFVSAKFRSKSGQFQSSLGGVRYVLGVTEASAIIASTYGESADWWISTAVDMVLMVFAERLAEKGLELELFFD